MTQRYLVVGTGLIGTSIALGLRAAGHIVLLHDTDPDALRVAIDASGGKAWDGKAQVDVAVVATPPATVAEVVRHLAENLPTAVITDVSSVKGSVLTTAGSVPGPQRIVGGHPMAGREVSGARAAQSNLFVDRPWVITRLAATDEDAVSAVRAMVADLGAVPVERAVADHDRAVALVSHTPQAVATVLAGRLLEARADDVELAGQGIRDTIRLAGSDAALWTQILLGNAAEVSTSLHAVAGDLARFAQAIERHDAAAVEATLQRGAAGRDRLPGKHGSAKTDVATLVVRVEDKPGELARLFHVAADADVNLEDVRIDHSMGRMTGLVELSVTTSSTARLVSALAAGGFAVIG